jgi:hypothetical protein
MKRITIAQIRQHPFFYASLPPYLSRPPSLAALEWAAASSKEAVVGSAADLDLEVALSLATARRRPPVPASHLFPSWGVISPLHAQAVDAVVAYGLPGAVSRDAVVAVILSLRRARRTSDIRVCYDLIVDHKQSKLLLEGSCNWVVTLCFRSRSLSPRAFFCLELSRPHSSQPPYIALWTVTSNNHPSAAFSALTRSPDLRNQSGKGCCRTRKRMAVLAARRMHSPPQRRHSCSPRRLPSLAPHL